MKQKAISNYECAQVSKFANDIYRIYGKNVDYDDWFGEAWIVYLQLRKDNPEKLADGSIWNEAFRAFRIRLQELQKENNQKRRMESPFSLNATYGESNAAAETWFCAKSGDFVNAVMLWDYAKGLGEEKNRILTFMNRREDDWYIMRKLHIPVERFYQLKAELRQDFAAYWNL